MALDDGFWERVEDNHAIDHHRVTPRMVDRGARALVRHVAGALPDDRWTRDAVQDVLRAVFDIDEKDAT